MIRGQGFGVGQPPLTQAIYKPDGYKLMEVDSIGCFYLISNYLNVKVVSG
ncbi:MAG: hypothetical protein ACXWMJ_12170 [Syntrophales bacterium]